MAIATVGVAKVEVRAVKDVVKHDLKVPARRGAMKDVEVAEDVDVGIPSANVLMPKANHTTLTQWHRPRQKPPCNKTEIAMTSGQTVGRAQTVANVGHARAVVVNVQKMVNATMNHVLKPVPMCVLRAIATYLWKAMVRREKAGVKDVEIAVAVAVAMTADHARTMAQPRRLKASNPS
jgi:hypothetical protein